MKAGDEREIVEGLDDVEDEETADGCGMMDAVGGFEDVEAIGAGKLVCKRGLVVLAKGCLPVKRGLSVKGFS